jgi:hypothetical protein
MRALCDPNAYNPKGYSRHHSVGSNMATSDGSSKHCGYHWSIYCTPLADTVSCDLRMFTTSPSAAYHRRSGMCVGGYYHEWSCVKLHTASAC